MRVLCELGANAKVAAGTTPLIGIIATNGDADGMSLILPLGVDVNTDEHGYGTPLHNAAELGHDSVVSILLRHGAKILPTSQKVTPLHCAAKNGHVFTVELLVKAGADLDARDYADNTPMAMAVINGHLKVVELLVKLGANVDVVNSQGRSLVHLAKTWEMIELLVRSGAPLNTKDLEGSTPVIAAINTENFELLEYLARAGAKVDELDKDGFTPLSKAIQNQHIKAIEPLIKAGANVNGVRFQKPPIHLAVQLSTPEVAAELLRFKPNVNAIHNGVTPLFLVAQPKIVKKLVQSGANINYKAQEDIATIHKGESPLHLVARLGTPETVRAMVQNGADIEAQNENGHTPLIMACNNQNFNVYTTLLDLGANINHKDKHGNTVMFHAVEVHNQQIFEDLITRGMDWKAKNNMHQRPLHAAASSGNIEALTKLAKLGGDVTEADYAGDMPMHYAVNRQSLPVVKELLRLGAPLEPLNGMGWTPLVLAGFVAPDLIKFFVQQGADINRQDRDGNTPLHLAIIHAGNKEGVKELLKAGADTTIRNKEGLLAADEANNKDYEIASLFEN